MSSLETGEVSSVKIAKESHQKAKLGRASKYLKVQKAFLYIFAILAAGFIELLIILLFTQL